MTIQIPTIKIVKKQLNGNISKSNIYLKKRKTKTGAHLVNKIKIVKNNCKQKQILKDSF